MRCFFAGAVISLCGVALAGAQSFDLVGIAPGARDSLGYGVSDSGRALAGHSVFASNNARSAFLWTADGGRSDFGDTMFPLTTQSFGISGDGSTAVGARHGSTSLPRAFRYRAGGEVQTLGVVAGYDRSWATGANYTGDVVIGWCQVDAGGFVGAGFRWTEGAGMQRLALPGAIYSRATGVSAAGDVVVGYGRGGAGINSAFVWSASNGISMLAPLPGTPADRGTSATGINASGTIIIGSSGANESGVVWRDGVVTPLPVPEGWERFVPRDVSDDGQIMVGGAAVWTPGRGTEAFVEYLASFGVSPPGGSIFEVSTVSADGRAFAGTIEIDGHYEAFVATIPSPASVMPMIAAVGVIAVRRRRMH